ncbi:MAG: PhzF family phenazine biosynthesis protein [Halieaceae bacterium]|jgi:predicted PhzF superfamily epimerase YddE/YHI9|nr:PhzF family phenazine biosynthesis protein [Halieaceae bacterium]
MQLTQYEVSAFSADAFAGNPAAVVPLENWLPDATLLAIAAENNLSETAFYLPEGDGFALRWFTPTVEVQLCGHATLASAHVLFNEQDYPGEEIRFRTVFSGELAVRRRGDFLCLDFPAHPVTPVPVDPAIASALGGNPLAAFRAPSWVYEFASEAEIIALNPDMKALQAATDLPVIVTAPGEAEDVDFVSRFFGPQVGVDEDPVTGSAHCALAPLWGAADRLDRDTLHARQRSARGGEIMCELRGDRVLISGRARTFLRGTIDIPDT